MCALTSASIAIPFVTVGALAAVTARRVGTSGVYVTRRFRAAALVDVHAFEPVETRVPCVALARVRSRCVHANSRVHVAVVSIWPADAQAFVHICTLSSIRIVSLLGIVMRARRYYQLILLSMHNNVS